MNPTTKHFARADGGSIDVQSYLAECARGEPDRQRGRQRLSGHTGAATEVFHLVQEFEITCSDASVSAVALTLDSSLVGFVRSKYKGERVRSGRERRR